MLSPHRKFRYARKMGYRSGLEYSVSQALEFQNVKFQYECMKIEWEDLAYRTYTPDFVLNNGIIIETKGIRTPEFKMRFKLFLKYLYDTNQKLDVYVPSNQKEVDATVNLILNRGSFKK